MMNDELLIYRGIDLKVNDYITIHQPTLGEISDYGEIQYFNMVHTLTSVGADLKWQLDMCGIDYTKISDFKLFYTILIENYSQEQTSILFGGLDFSKFVLLQSEDETMRMIQKVENEKGEVIDYIIIDEFTYMMIVDYLRKAHGFKKNSQLPANESTKRVLIEDDKDEYERNKDKEQEPILLNSISAMVNSEGFKYNNDTVWNLKICPFIDSLKRIQKIKESSLLLQSGYSGYGIDLKNIEKKQLNWLGGLD